MLEVDIYQIVILEGLKYGLILGGTSILLGEGINLALKLFKG